MERRPESACKPDSVSRARPLRDGASLRSSVLENGHPFPHAAYPEVLPEARKGCGAHPSMTLSLLLGLAPDGGCLAMSVTWHAGGLLHHLFTLASWIVDPGITDPGSRSVSVALSAGRPARVLPGIAPCGVRTFLTWDGRCPPGATARPTQACHLCISIIPWS